MRSRIKAGAIWKRDPTPGGLWNLFRLPGVSLRNADMVKEDRDVFLIFGGDGTVHLFLQQLVASQKPVLVVPIGSGNDFARALGIRSVDDAFAAWKRFCECGDNVRSIDLGIIRSLSDHPRPQAQRRPTKMQATGLSEDETYFCCIAGVGLDSEANRRANAMPSWLRGHGGYIAAVLGAVAAYKPQRISIESSVGRPTSAGPGPSGSTGLRNFSAPAMFVAFGNAQSYGSGMRITPKAELDDGKLDVCFVHAVGKARLLRLFPTVFSGKHLGIDVVEYFQAERIKVETESPLDLYADGEFICRTPVELTVAPRAMRVIAAVGT